MKANPWPRFLNTFANQYRKLCVENSQQSTAPLLQALFDLRPAVSFSSLTAPPRSFLHWGQCFFPPFFSMKIKIGEPSLTIAVDRWIIFGNSLVVTLKESMLAHSSSCSQPWRCRISSDEGPDTGQPWEPDSSLMDLDGHSEKNWSKFVLWRHSGQTPTLHVGLPHVPYVPPQVSVAEGLKLASGLSHKVHAEGLPGYPSSPKKGRLTVIWNQNHCFIMLYLHLSCILIYIYICHTTKGFTAWILESDYLQAESSVAGLHVQPPCETDLLMYDI